MLAHKIRGEVNFHGKCVKHDPGLGNHFEIVTCLTKADSEQVYWIKSAQWLSSVMIIMKLRVPQEQSLYLFSITAAFYKIEHGYCGPLDVTPCSSVDG
jgi:hypothetical protein